MAVENHMLTTMAVTVAVLLAGCGGDSKTDEVTAAVRDWYAKNPRHLRCEYSDGRWHGVVEGRIDRMHVTWHTYGGSRKTAGGFAFRGREWELAYAQVQVLTVYDVPKIYEHGDWALRHILMLKCTRTGRWANMGSRSYDSGGPGMFPRRLCSMFGPRTDGDHGLPLDSQE